QKRFGKPPLQRGAKARTREGQACEDREAHPAVRLRQPVERIDEKDWLADADRNRQPEIAAHTVDDGFRAAICITGESARHDGHLRGLCRRLRPPAWRTIGGNPESCVPITRGSCVGLGPARSTACTGREKIDPHVLVPPPRTSLPDISIRTVSA